MEPTIFIIFIMCLLMSGDFLEKEDHAAPSSQVASQEESEDCTELIPID
jgi:hypothetical protein